MTNTAEWKYRWFGLFKAQESAEHPYVPLLEDWRGGVPYPDLREIVSYLEQAVVILAVQSIPTPCMLCEREFSSAFHSDDVWVWPIDLGHMVLEHGVRLPDQFVARIRSLGYMPPERCETPIAELPLLGTSSVLVQSDSEHEGMGFG